jgi:hypothetical protein
MIKKSYYKIKKSYYKIKNRISKFLDLIMNPLRSIKDSYYNIKNGIPNLIKWFPIIWKDRDWDFYFIFVLLHRKLKNMEKHIRSYSHHTNSEKDADQIKLCVDLLKRILDDEYHENVFKDHDKKWGEGRMVWEDTDDCELSKLDIIRDNANTEEEKEQETKDFRRLSPNVEKLKQQDINYLFDNMKKHIQCWWD